LIFENVWDSIKTPKLPGEGHPEFFSGSHSIALEGHPEFISGSHYQWIEIPKRVRNDLVKDF
jgi:hypothetical protein